MKTQTELKPALDFLLKKGMILEGFTNFVIQRGNEYFELTDVLTDFANNRLSDFIEFTKDNYGIEIHDMIVQEFKSTNPLPTAP